MRDKFYETHVDDGMRHSGLVSTKEERRIENMEAALHAYRRDATKYKQLHSEAQARIEALQAEITASAARVTELEDALRATVAYMKEDSVGYEVYRATLDAAEAALSIKVGETK